MCCVFFYISQQRSLLQRIQIQPALSKRNRSPLQKWVSVTRSSTCGGKSRVKQSRVSKGESFPGKARCTTRNLFSRRRHLLFPNDSIRMEETADRPVN